MTTAPDAAREPRAAVPLPAQAERGEDDGPLESIGKAVAAPVVGAAEEEEPNADPKKPPVPPG